MNEVNVGRTSKCYIIFDYVWHLSGVKPARNCFKSFDSIKEAGEHLISIFSRDLNEGIFETLLSEEEMGDIKAAVAELKQEFVVNNTINFKVKLDLSCFEFKILALCIWPNGAEKILQTVVEILKGYQAEDFADHHKAAEANYDLDGEECYSFYKKAQVLMENKKSALDQEKFDEVFDYMIYNHSCE